VSITLGSHFDGISAFPFAASFFGIKTRWATEVEPFPIQVSKHHFPDVKHYGDIIKVNGAELEPVDIITFGSPCQDMSVAGKREGLYGERSGLFMQAVRTIREMREATNGTYPRFAIWENVPGAFSSNSGFDFKAVLEEITESKIPMPASGKWATAGMVRGDGRSVAWRTMDAQYWGVPQRRRRIFLIADFAGQRAAEILFEPEGMRWDFAEGGEAREEVAGSARDGTETASRINCTGGGIAGTVSSKWAKGTGGPAGDEHYNLVLADQGGSQMSVSYDKAPTLRAQEHGHQPCVLDKPQLYDMTHAEEVIRPVEPGIAPTLNARMGTGGNQVPVMLDKVSIGFNGDQSEKTRSMGETIEQCPTLRSGGATHVAYGPGGQGEVAHALRAQASKADKPSSTTYICEPIAFNTFGGNKRKDRPEGGMYVNIPAEKAKPLDTNGATLNTQQGGTGVLEPIAFNGRQDPVSGNIPGSLGVSLPQAQCIAFAQNQRDEVRDLKDKAGALAAANMSFRDDSDNLVCSVDCRNLYENEEISGTLQCKQTGGYSLNYQNPVRIGYAVRRLTPLECERLQNFPDSWTNIPGASDTARYKAVGNSIAIPPLMFIFSQLTKAVSK